MELDYSRDAMINSKNFTMLTGDDVDELKIFFDIIEENLTIEFITQ